MDHSSHSPSQAAARIRRDTPQRSGPLRSAAAMWRPEEPGPGAPAEAGPAAAADPVENAVFTAYQVLEQAMRRGRDAARRYTTSSDGDPTMSGERNGQDPRDLYAQAFRAWTGMLSTWADLLGPLIPPGMRPAWPPAAPGESAPPQGVHLVLDVASSRPVEVELDLQPAAPGAELAVQDLRAFEPGKPAIPGARLERLDGGRLRLHLRVPQDQPPGVYAGMVYDPARSERCGSLTVRLAA